MNAKIDQNRQKTIIGVSSADFSTPVDVAVDPNTQAELVESVEVSPTNPSKLNPSVTFNFTGSQLTSIVKTVGSTSYTKTITYPTNQIIFSAWV
jgi:hypothetical protein